jgi:Tfp pilus assembly pilus retraction ATPase PilT
MPSSNLLANILNYAIKHKASDIHISGGKPLSYRIKKHIVTKEEA